MSRIKIKELIAASSASLVLVMGVGTGIVSAAKPIKDNDGKVIICHGTNSATNPYVVTPVDADAADGNTGNDNGQGDHTTHTGPIATSESVANALKDSKTAWGDIIPPHDNYAGLNWDATGQAMWNNDCNFVTPGGNGGEEPGTPGTPSNPQVLGDSVAQVTTKPAGAVAAGNGGAKQMNTASVVGLTGSLAVVLAGAVFAVKRFVRL